MPDTHDITIRQGSTFTRIFKYSQPQFSSAAITAITKAGQAVVTAVAHGIPADWKVWVVGVLGMTKLNHKSSYLRDPDWAYYAYYVAPNTIRLDVDTSALAAYTSGGELLYHPPMNLTGFTARMQIRKTVQDTAIVHTLTSENGGIILGGASGTVELNIPAATTATFTFDEAVYDLELISPTGTVSSPVNTSVVILTKEVTR